MGKFYCKCCGSSYSDVRTLTVNSCQNSESGKHELYEGNEANKYYCKWCGSSYSDLRTLTVNSCSYSPSKKHQNLTTAST